MKERDKTINALQHIIADYNSILEYVMNCRNNDLDYCCSMAIMPFFCMYVAEGFDYLVKNQIINADCISLEDLRRIKKCRALGVKLYSSFKQSTFNSINDFNREEYIKFFKKAFPNSNVKLLKIVDNYFLCFVDGLPVGNYHLYAKKILNMDIGSYIEDVSGRVYQHSYLLTSFISTVVKSLNQSLNIDTIGKKAISIQADYADLNMAYNYSNFSIKNCPPILMALLDVLCVVNSFRKVFSLINKDEIFGIKVGYSILFYSVLSIKEIILYCESNSIIIPAAYELLVSTDKLENKYIKNRLRKFCMHYDFPENDWIEEPFSEEFENNFDMDLKAVFCQLTEDIDMLGDSLQTFLIKRDFISQP